MARIARRDGRRGVSPVIGVVLLVAVTVVLAGGTAALLTSTSEELY